MSQPNQASEASTKSDLRTMPETAEKGMEPQQVPAPNLSDFKTVSDAVKEETRSKETGEEKKGDESSLPVVLVATHYLLKGLKRIGDYSLHPESGWYSRRTYDREKIKPSDAFWKAADKFDREYLVPRLEAHSCRSLKYPKTLNYTFASSWKEVTEAEMNQGNAVLKECLEGAYAEFSKDYPKESKFITHKIVSQHDYPKSFPHPSVDHKEVNMDWNELENPFDWDGYSKEITEFYSSGKEQSKAYIDREEFLIHAPYVTIHDDNDIELTLKLAEDRIKAKAQAQAEIEAKAQAQHEVEANTAAASNLAKNTKMNLDDSEIDQKEVSEHPPVEGTFVYDGKFSIQYHPMKVIHHMRPLSIPGFLTSEGNKKGTSEFIEIVQSKCDSASKEEPTKWRSNLDDVSKDNIDDLSKSSWDRQKQLMDKIIEREYSKDPNYSDYFNIIPSELDFESESDPPPHIDLQDYNSWFWSKGSSVFEKYQGTRPTTQGKISAK
ncbi:uncharacterized protein I206_101382 [Kwoniella pini CBS 10737]|uniref:Uncharacterized protein n=1 Tax=Kwoniella pini CBS 10737 TaxID=1296096 RepID=A0A1B9HWV1_9TREE|nr:uncharacterized protein I206_06648 [Kwoniella pini CBS 10737]OCF47742.1 hypothetical protein I206_06648 [Kwoniella pini CBS 10737]